MSRPQEVSSPVEVPRTALPKTDAEMRAEAELKLKSPFNRGLPGNSTRYRQGDEAREISNEVPRNNDFMSLADKSMKLSPQEKALFERHKKNLSGPGGVDNEDGSRSTLYASTVNIDKQAYVIPRVWDGKVVPVREAVQRAEQEGLDKFPAYESDEMAEERYGQLHKFIEDDTRAHQELMKKAKR